MKITNISALQVLDSRGIPTIEVFVETDLGSFAAIAPSGTSASSKEAVELRDNSSEYFGYSVKNAIELINSKISESFIGLDLSSHSLKDFDSILLELDSSKDKSVLGGNTMIALSTAFSRAFAAENESTLFDYLSSLVNSTPSIPIPAFNLINGGEHSNSNIAFQEFHLVPWKASSFEDAIQIGAECFHHLEKIISDKFGPSSTGTGLEGGFVINSNKNSVALDLLMTAIESSGFVKECAISIDAAANSFYKNKSYILDGKKFSSAELIDYYADIVEHYPLISLEDPFDENDAFGWGKIVSSLPKKIQILGDDLTSSNISFSKKFIESNYCTGIILKPNQVGTISETMDTAKYIISSKKSLMCSHRSGDSEDSFIADLAVGLGCGQIKAGAPSRGERTSKYNRLLEISHFNGLPFSSHKVFKE